MRFLHISGLLPINIIILTLLTISGLLSEHLEEEEAGALTNSKRPLHHQQLLLQRQRLLRHNEVADCTNSPARPHPRKDIGDDQGNDHAENHPPQGGASALAAGALSAIAAGELNNDTGDRARRSSTLTPASDLVPCTYFTGRTHEAMRYRAEDTDVSYPNEGFTISLRVKPEGGQISPAVVIAMVDTCSPNHRDNGWSLGIETLDELTNSDPRWFFKLGTDRAPHPTTIYSFMPYQNGQWVDLTATYDTQQMSLYVNSVRVASSAAQRGIMFHPFTRGCKDMVVGGVTQKNKHFRGSIADLRLWDTVLSHSRIKANVLQISSTGHDYNSTNGSHLVVHERFASLLYWDPIDIRHPNLVSCDFNEFKKSAYVVDSLQKPSCGKTICDDPRVIRSYERYGTLRHLKNIRYRVVNVWNDDGTNPTVTREQIEEQHDIIQRAFRPYNISWQLEVQDVHNSSLRQKTILYGCEPHKVGDGVCTKECRHDNTGQDGGDCDVIHSECRAEQIGDGVCDEECNRYYQDWDGGDCCNGDVTDTLHTCFDPSSPHRSYLSLDEYKVQLDLDSTSSLNIYFASWTIAELMGVASFPWDKTVHSVLGGTVVKPAHFGHTGHTHTLVHELGHNLGLWHVHHGVTEADDCDDPCYETHASMTKGDLCADTNPTPQNTDCRNPSSRDLIYYNGRHGGQDLKICGKTEYPHTPYDNYMSYAGDSCINHFTPQQVARMHCYVDLVYKSWVDTPTPSPVPLPPTIVDSTSPSSLTITWLPPLDSYSRVSSQLCPQCDKTGTFTQYGHHAWSEASLTTGAWGPGEAIGPPDAAVCKPEVKSWIPYLDRCGEFCFLEVQFQYPVIASRLTIWVPWTSEGYLQDVELFFVGGTNHSLGQVPVLCDMPYSTELQFSKPIEKIRIYSDGPYIAIDSVQLKSRALYPECDVCPQLQYKIIRHPAFNVESLSEGESVSSTDHASRRAIMDIQDGCPIVDDVVFTDSEVEEGVSYSYYIQAMLLTMTSELSPPLHYTMGSEFCGDGIVGREEECDDSNLHAGDGCSADCSLEPSYKCTGSPSLCYMYVGDDVCESFERSTTHTTPDCGLDLPRGFSDQWAVNVTSEAEGQSVYCPVDVLLGPPPKTLVCGDHFDYSYAWNPCDASDEQGNYWVKFDYEHAVVATNVLVYLASDGTFQYDTERKDFRVKLIDTEGQTHDISPPTDEHQDAQNNIFSAQAHTAKCSENPAILNVQQNLSEPFFLTQGVLLHFTSPHLAFAAVGLRSRTALNPVTIETCSREAGDIGPGLYNPRSGRCIRPCEDCDCPLQQQSCNRFHVKHGTVNCTGTLEGDICDVICNPGYEHGSVSSTSRCVGGRWTGSGGSRMCSPVDCGQPSIPHSRTDCPHGTLYRDICKHECRYPARMIGDANRIHCESDGLWSLSASYCKVMCDGPPTVKNATIISTACRAGDHVVGTKCRLRCERGYYVQGFTSRKRAMRHRCSDAGEWVGPVCLRVQCPSIPDVYHGMYSCTHQRYAGSLCTLKCPGPERLSSNIRCLSGGDWDSEFLQCDFSPASVCPRVPRSRDVQYGCANYDMNHDVNYNVGTVCAPFCTDPFGMAVLRDTVGPLDSHPGHQPTTQEPYTTEPFMDQDYMEYDNEPRRRRRDVTGGLVGDREVVDWITCTGAEVWYPDPADVICVEGCSMRFIGDGYCDGRNNHAYCEWDGGDCCESTVLEGIVQPFPDTCTTDCQCRDPLASENQYGAMSASSVTRHQTRNQNTRLHRQITHSLRIRHRKHHILARKHDYNSLH